MVIDIEQPGRVPPLADRELRMNRAAGIPIAADYLRRHYEGADEWGDEERRAVGGRLLFAMHLMAEGKLSDD